MPRGKRKTNSYGQGMTQKLHGNKTPMEEMVDAGHDIAGKLRQGAKKSGMLSGKGHKISIPRGW